MWRGSVALPQRRYTPAHWLACLTTFVQQSAMTAVQDDALMHLLTLEIPQIRALYSRDVLGWGPGLVRIRGASYFVHKLCD